MVNASVLSATVTSRATTSLKVTDTKGFTLIEVMVALTIFAVLSIAMSKVGGESADRLLHLEQKTLATWVAENQLTEMRMQPEPPSIGRRQERVEMANQNWQIEIEVKQTDVTGFNSIEVSVAKEESPERVLAVMSGFVRGIVL